MKSFKIFIAVVLSLFISACSEPHPKLSELYHEKWNEKLEKAEIDYLRICVTGARESGLGCLFEFGPPQSGHSYVMKGTFMTKEEGQWRVYVPDGIEDEIVFKDAFSHINEATRIVVTSRQLNQKVRATWETDGGTE
jgi:hypothetical protein